MPDTDKTLEAEQLILQVADELKRMKDAANLLDSAQEKVDSVLSSSEKIVQDIEKFSSACGSILTKLSETDLTRHLDELQAKNKEIAAMVSKGGEDTTHAIATLESRIGDTQDRLLTMEADLTRHLDELQAKNKEIAAMVSKGGEDTTHAIATLESRIGDTQDKLLTMEKESRIRQFITMGFVVLTFFSASAILLIQPFAFN